MRKTTVIVMVVLFAASAGAVEAVIDPGSPSDLVLDDDNSWETSKTFDGSKSTGSGTLTYSWNWEEESETDSGTEASFTFNRNSPQTNTIKLTVSNGTHSDTEEVTQVLRDEPEVTENAGSDLDDIDIDDGAVTKTYSTSDFSITNTFDSPVTYSWNIESGEKTRSGTSIDYTFSDTDDKTVELTVTDSEGYSGKDTITVDVTNSSSGSSSNNNQQQTTQTAGTSSGGAPGLASGFDESEYLFSVDEGMTAEAEFSESPVTKLSIEIAENIEKTVVIQSKASDERPDGPDSDPSGEVYEYVDINPVNITDSDIENVTFSFQVNRSWIKDNSIANDSIGLLRYDDGWNELSTTMTDTDSDYFYYEAVSPGFSAFAIKGEKKSADFQVQELSVNTTSISPNETVRIDIEVKNAGEATGNYTLSFELAGESFERKFVDVAPGETRNASFVKMVNQEGSWDIKAGEKSVTVDSSPPGSAQDDINLTGQGQWKGIVGITVLLALILSVSGGVLLYTEKGDEIIPYLEEIREDLGIDNEGDGFSFDDYFGEDEGGEEDDFEYDFDWED